MKVVSGLVGVVYFGALFAAWHLLPLGLETGIRGAMGMGQAVWGAVIPAHVLYPELYRVYREELDG